MALEAQRSYIPDRIKIVQDIEPASNTMLQQSAHDQHVRKPVRGRSMQQHGFQVSSLTTEALSSSPCHLHSLGFVQGKTWPSCRYLSHFLQVSQADSLHEADKTSACRGCAVAGQDHGSRARKDDSVFLQTCQPLDLPACLPGNKGRGRQEILHMNDS